MDLLLITTTIIINILNFLSLLCRSFHFFSCSFHLLCNFGLSVAMKVRFLIFFFLLFFANHDRDVYFFTLLLCICLA